MTKCLDHPTRAHSFTTVKEAPDTQRGLTRDLSAPALGCRLSVAVISGSPVHSVLRRRRPERILPLAIPDRSQAVKPELVDAEREQHVARTTAKGGIPGVHIHHAIDDNGAWPVYRAALGLNAVDGVVVTVGIVLPED